MALFAFVLQRNNTLHSLVTWPQNRKDDFGKTSKQHQGSKPPHLLQLKDT
jgi:hypothetical protein